MFPIVFNYCFLNVFIKCFMAPLKIVVFSFYACQMIAIRGGFRAAATSKMERFAIIVNCFHPLTIITKRSILNAAVVLDPPLVIPWLHYNAG